MTRETVLNNLYDDDGNFFSSSPKHRWGGFEVEIGSKSSSFNCSWYLFRIPLQTKSRR